MIIGTGDDLLADDLDRPHDLIVRGVADLEHEYHLIDPGRGPAFHLATYAVGVAADRHAGFQQVVVRITRHARLDPRHALGRAEPHVVQLRVVVAVVEPRRRTADIAADPVIVVHAADGEHADVVVDETADRRGGGDRRTIRLDMRPDLGMRVSGDAEDTDAGGTGALERFQVGRGEP